VAFQVAAANRSALETEWVHPLLGEELVASSLDDDLISRGYGLLALEHADEVRRIGPGRAGVRVALERSWPSGQFDHLLYDLTLAISDDGSWRVVSMVMV
jgi:hypothetical protein